MHFVTSVEYVSGYKLRVGFEDDSVRVVDLAAELNGEIFEPLKDLRIFRTARLNPDLDTVVWSNGADVSPACGPSLAKAQLPLRDRSADEGQA